MVRMLMYVLFSIALGLLTLGSYLPKSRIVMLSVSSDGRYVLSSHYDQSLWLWDVKRKEKHRIAKKVNYYSPYFITHRHQFIWQDLDNQVHLGDVNQKSNILFKTDFQTYGHVMSHDMKHYFSTDRRFAIFWYHNALKKLLKPADDAPNYDGVSHILNISLSNDDRYLLSGVLGSNENDKTLSENIFYDFFDSRKKGLIYSPFAGVVVWDVDNGRPVHQLAGNHGKLNAVMSPDNLYIASGDEKDNTLLWRLDSGRLVHRYQSNTKHENRPVIATRFITNNQMLQFSLHRKQAYLFDVYEDKLQKSVSFPDKYADVGSYQASMRIATAPEAGILAMANKQGNNILVYRYSLEEDNLKPLWH